MFTDPDRETGASDSPDATSSRRPCAALGSLVLTLTACAVGSGTLEEIDGSAQGSPDDGRGEYEAGTRVDAATDPNRDADPLALPDATAVPNDATRGDASAESSAPPGADAGRQPGASSDASACATLAPLAINDSVVGAGQDQFQYEGAWSQSTGAGKYQEDDHYASAAGSSATFRFRGVSIALRAARAVHHGIAAVSIDAEPVADVDLYAAARADDVEVWKKTGLAAGDHVLRLAATGRRNAAATEAVIAVDRVEVERATCAGP